MLRGVRGEGVGVPGRWRTTLAEGDVRRLRLLSTPTAASGGIRQTDCETRERP